MSRLYNVDLAISLKKKARTLTGTGFFDIVFLRRIERKGEKI